MTMLSEGEATVMAMRLAEAAIPLLGNQNTAIVGAMFIARSEELILAFAPHADPERAPE